ncbi:hypothetical protein ACFWC5_36935 [Streptomyces sp. NPDC060085]|uniref:hypothetical protein n=1 Tax=Streptomyces sp. NPDC060085 TaxID=3347054 RepID=UPI0036478211
MMTDMNQWIDFLSGNFVSGLIGAAIGGAASIWGARMQAKASDRTARDTAARGTAQEAYELVSEVLSLMQAKSEISSPEDGAAWNSQQQVLVSRARTGVSLLPPSEDVRRTRCRESLKLISLYDGHVTWDDHVVLTSIALNDVMAHLGTYFSGRDLPAPTDVKARIETERKQRRRIKIGRMLVALEQIAEHQGGLTPDEEQQANAIRAELGVQHSGELPASERAAITA